MRQHLARAFAALLALGLAAAPRAEARARAIEIPGIFNLLATGTFQCDSGEAKLVLWSHFFYRRGFFEKGELPWTLALRAVTADGDDTIVKKSGTFPAMGNGGHLIEEAHTTFLTDLCPLIAELGNSSPCVTLFVEASVEGTQANIKHNAHTNDFEVCCDSCLPFLAVEMDEMSAEWTAPGYAAIRWSTLSETDTVGFRVAFARRERGPWTSINDGAIVPATGSATSGESYMVLHENKRPRSAAWYRIEDIDMNGVVTAHDPIRMAAPGAPAKAPAGGAAKKPSGH